MAFHRLAEHTIVSIAIFLVVLSSVHASFLALIETLVAVDKHRPRRAEIAFRS
jgi:hypothetical protein